MAQSTGDQLTQLRASLEAKLGELQGMIGKEDDTLKGCMSEIKSLTAKLAEVDARLNLMKAARKEYAKTIQETDFAQQKIEETAQTMAERFSKLSKVQVAV